MAKTEQRGVFKKLFARTLLGVNIVLFGLILWRLPAAVTQWWGSEAIEDLTEDTGPRVPRTRARNPLNHLPLKGMAEFEGDQRDACLRMEGFLLDMDYELAKADLNARVQLEDALRAVKAGGCAIDTPEVAKTIAELNAARVVVGLPVLPPASD